MTSAHARHGIKFKLMLVIAILLIPSFVSIFIYWTSSAEHEKETISRSEELSAMVREKSTSSIDELGKELIMEKAISVSKELHHYIEHKASTKDYLELEKDEELKKIAVQPVGKTGYTAVHDTNGINHFHINPALVGTDLHSLAEKFPAFWAILEKSLAGEGSGFYEWQDADGAVRKKYMHCLPVEGTELRVCATTYIDELAGPAYKLYEEVNTVTGAAATNLKLENNKNFRTFVFSMVLIILFSIMLVSYISSSIAVPITNLTIAAREIEKGNLNQRIRVKTGDELEELAQSFNSMLKAIKNAEDEQKRYSAKLKGEVRKSTSVLKHKMEELEKTKTATLNILEDINEANEKLKEIDKMKDEFLSVVSHELKTPITPIKAYIEMFMDGTLGRTNSDQKTALQTIQRNTERLKRLIEDILDISRIQTGKIKFNFEKVDLNELVKTTVADRQIFANQKQISLDLESKKLPNTITDKFRLIQVLTNLLDNAIKFSPEKSTIQLNAFIEGNYVRFHVIDHGIGIAKENHEKLFNKFYQVDPSVKRKYGGAGLGLAICRGIVEMLGGKISLASELGKGADFNFTLPITKNLKRKES